LVKSSVTKPSLGQRLSGSALLIVFLGSVVPMLLIPFVNVLPYLQRWSLAGRLTCSVLLWVTAYLLAVVTCSREQLRSIAAVAFHSRKQRIGMVLGTIMFMYAGAKLSANSFGLLVWMLPNSPYMGQFEVMAATSSGSKYKSLDLDLQAERDGREYHLTLSKRLFDLPQYQPGDRVVLRGKENLFGIYIESMRINGVRLD
jgi:hypothetical protein